MLPRSRTHGRDEKGSISVWMITTALTMTLLVGLAVDLGGQVYAKQRAQDLAAQAARSGGQQLVASSSVRGVSARVAPAAAVAAARTYIAGAPGYSGSARVTGGTTVVADTHTTYTTKFLSIIGIRTLRVTGHAEVRVERVLEGVRQ